MENVEMKIRHYEKRQKFLTKKKKKWDNMNLIFYGLNSFHVSWYLFLALAVSSLIWKFSEGYIFMVMIIYKVVLFPARKLAEKKVARYTKRLKELTEEVNETLTSYYNDRRAECGFPNGVLLFTNGIGVCQHGTRVMVELPKNYGRMRVYIKDGMYLNHIEEEKIMNMVGKGTGKVLLNERIPSVDFNKAFWVVADAGTERDCLAYLSPSMQLNLIKGGGPTYKDSTLWGFATMRLEGNHYSMLTIIDNYLYLDVSYKQAEGGLYPVDFLNEMKGSKDIRGSFMAVDRFCETFPQVALETAIMVDEKIGFLRGNII